MYKALIVGCGITGAVVARELADAGWCVSVCDRRNHIGGNMYDYYDEHGILVHKYGPHTFHTKEKRLYDYVCRFGQWEPYKLTCGAVIDNRYTPTPFNFATIDTFYNQDDAKDLKERIGRCFPGRKTATVVEVLNCSDPVVKSYAEFLFAKDYSLYTAKQWGVPASMIDPSVLKRVPLRFSYDVGYFDDAYEVMPKTTYEDFFRNLLNHPNIEVQLNVDAHAFINLTKPLENPVIYTGAIDELFDYRHGALPYRSLRFEWHHSNEKSFQNAPVVAYPQDPDFTRITEYSKLPVQLGKGTSYAVEYSLPCKENDKSEPYYPVMTVESLKRYQLYLDQSLKTPNLYVCGRLGCFKYFNMDQALSNALEVAMTIRKDNE